MVAFWPRVWSCGKQWIKRFDYVIYAVNDKEDFLMRWWQLQSHTTNTQAINQRSSRIIYCEGGQAERQETECRNEENAIKMDNDKTDWEGVKWIK
jgi:hypothetical protein